MLAWFDSSEYPPNIHRSSNGKTTASKTVQWAFESLPVCQMKILPPEEKKYLPCPDCFGAGMTEWRQVCCAQGTWDPWDDNNDVGFRCCECYIPEYQSCELCAATGTIEEERYFFIRLNKQP